MRKTIEEKAITLIALIITIVVLLILAVVAINAVTGDGIIQHATNAKTEYEKAQVEEESILSYYGEYLENKGNVGLWRQQGDNLVLKDGSVTIAIGDKVDYQPTELSYTSPAGATGIGSDQTFKSSSYTDGWQVLGIENGNLLLISSDVIKSTDNKDYSIFVGKELYLNGPTELNNICAIFGKGNGAQGARSVKVEDINKITGYDPEKLGNLRTDIGKYGNTITYEVINNELTYTCTLVSGGKITENYVQPGVLNTIYHLEDNDWKYNLLEEGETRSFTFNEYDYYSSVKSSPEEGKSYIEMKMDTSTTKYKMLFNESIGKYWLASPVVQPLNTEDLSKYKNVIYYGIRHVNPDGGVNNLTVSQQLNETRERGVRVVVTLKENAKLNYDKTNDIWKIVNE